MRTNQQKFLARMETLAEEAALDLVVDFSFSNVGRVYFQHKNSFTPLFDFRFDFQSGYSGFRGDKLIRQYHYVKVHELDGVIEEIKTALYDALGES